MKTLHFATALCLLMITEQTIQGQGWEWAKSVYGSDDVEIICAETDAFDNLYIGGRFKDTMFFTPIDYLVAPTNYFDGFIAKYDSNGEFLWSRKFGGNHNDHARDISIDDSGFVYVTCYARSSNTVSYDSFSYTGTGNDKTFIIKIDPQGNLIWGKLVTSGNSNAYPSSISANAGIVAVTGTYSALNMIIENDTLFHVGGTDIFLVAYESTTGNLLWTKSIASKYQDYGFHVAVDDSANVYMAGMYYDTLSIGGADTLYNQYNYDIVLSKHNVNGDYVWAKSYSSPTNLTVYGMTLNTSGDIYITGWKGSSINLVLNDTVMPFFPITNFFLQKVDHNGDSYWTKTFNFPQGTRLFDIATDSIGNVYLAGTFDNSFTLGGFPLSSSKDNNRNFLAKIDSLGNITHAFDGGDNITKNQNLNNLVSYSKGVYLVGYFGSAVGDTCAFGNDTLISAGGSDGYISKYTYSQISLCNVVSDFDISAPEFCMGDTAIFSNQSTSATHYKWHNNGLFVHSDTNHAIGFLQTGTYEVMLVAFDSICSDTSIMQVNVQQSYLFSENHTICKGDTFLFGLKELTEPGYYTNTFTSVNGCDSNYHLDLNIHEINISVLVSQNVLTAVAENHSYQWVECGNSFSHIQGADSQQFTALQNGKYAVIISDSLCSDTSACYLISGVGFPDKSSIKNVVYYPNPAKDVVFIEVNEETHLKVYDLLGNEVMATTLNSGANTINLSYLSSGFYILVFELPSHSVYDKILIQ